ncbi:MAG TPA: class I SAM-dependent methyltransferase [Stellaceae bacterium]|jgi:hypothetical protein|nr:class I SAM-dependent methyltransferase [Stellaceae bacterium]
MYYFFGDRSRWLCLLPKGARWAEIGVFRGDNAARLMEICEPAELHLIDPWHFALDFDWHNPPAWSPAFGEAARLVRQLSEWAGVPPGDHVNHHFERLYQQVAARFDGDARVTIHRAASRDAVTRFPDRYFDFVYVDGAHDYESVLADLHLYGPKLADHGILLGDDFCEHGAAENAQYGVIAAVAKFLRRTGPRTMILNNEFYSFFALLRSEAALTGQLLQKMVDSDLYFLEINDALMLNYHHKLIRRSDGGIRGVPSF